MTNLLSVHCIFCLVQELQTAAVCRIWSASKILSVRSTLFLYFSKSYWDSKSLNIQIFFICGDNIYTVFCVNWSSINSGHAHILQTNATRWLCKEARRCRLLLQRRAAGRELQLGQQLQEEVCLSVSPADLHLHPLHQPKHLTVRLQVCVCAHFHPCHPHSQPQSWAAGAHKRFLWWTVQWSMVNIHISIRIALKPIAQS